MADIRPALARLERALVHEGSRELRRLVLESPPERDLSWPRELPPLPADVAAWLGFRRQGDAESHVSLDVPTATGTVTCWLLSPERAAALMREKGEAGPLVPLLVEAWLNEVAFVCDVRDGSVGRLGWHDDAVTQVVTPAAADIAGWVEGIAAAYAARRSSPWRRMRVAPLTAPWAPIAPLTAPMLEGAPMGTALAFGFQGRGRRRTRAAVKLDADRWMTTAVVLRERGLADAACDAFRSCFADASVETLTCEGLATELAAMATKRASEDFTLHRGALRLWEQPPVETLLTRLAAVLKERFPRIVLHAGASPDEIDRLAAAVGRPLPADLVGLYSFANGQLAGRLFMNFELASIASLLDTMDGLRELRDVRFGAEYWDDSFVPFLDKGNADCLYVDVAGVHGPEGSIVDFDHESPSRRAVLYESVTSWLECLVDGLAEGLYVDIGGGIFQGASADVEAQSLHDAVRTNERFPWERTLKLRG